MCIVKALTIAGSDSGGGAGIEADLKTFAALGVHGMVALTAITAQNTVGISAIHEVPPEIVRKQIEAVVIDIGVELAKTGMLPTPAIIRSVSSLAEEFKLRLVVDPVMFAKSGAALLNQEALVSLKSELIPLAEVVTPNLHEARLLTGIEIESLGDSVAAGNAILDLGPRAAVVKGGHLKGDPVDVLCFKGGMPQYFSAERIHSSATHGTGCVFSSALVAYLANGLPLGDAVRSAKDFVTNAIIHGLPIGKGAGPVNPMSNLEIDAERFRVMSTMHEAISIIESAESMACLSPECQINIAMALPARYAVDAEAICAIPGRIFNAGGHLKAASCPAFGGSRHVAKVILASMSFDSSMRSAMNIRHSDKILEICRRLGYRVSSYDRIKEPPGIKAKEGASIQWGVGEAIRSHGSVPDIISHDGDWGKEPMINILGRDAVEVAMKALRIGRALMVG